MAHEITGVKVAQKTWHKLLDDRQHATESSHIASAKETVEDDTAKKANSKVQESVKGLNYKHSKFEIEQRKCHRHTPVRDFDHGSRRTGRSQEILAKARVNTQAKGKANT